MKRNIVILILLLISGIAKAQYSYSPNTYYLIPPSNGCNGVWAIKDTLLCSQYAFNPCWQFDHMVGDTMFLKLCSIPCSFNAITHTGDICVQAICGPLAPNGINESNKQNDLDILWQDNYSFSLKNRNATFDRVSIISLTGQVVKDWTSIIVGEEVTFDMQSLESGPYIIRIHKNGCIVNAKKIEKY